MRDDTEFKTLNGLLPFYVNGTLGAHDCARIDAAAATSPALREELAAIANFAHKVRTAGRALMESSATGAFEFGQVPAPKD